MVRWSVVALLHVASSSPLRRLAHGSVVILVPAATTSLPPRSVLESVLVAHAGIPPRILYDQKNMDSHTLVRDSFLDVLLLKCVVTMRTKIFS